MVNEKFDLIVIGAGPGGYVAAIRAAQLGMKVAIVEKRSSWGGICLNEGCIPSKALLDSSELFVRVRDNLAFHGILVAPPKLDLETMMLRKEGVVKKLSGGIDYLLKKHGISGFCGRASLKGSDAIGQHRVEIRREQTDTVSVESPSTLPAGATDILMAPRVLLSTGSESIALPGIPFDGRVVVSSREALEFDEIPEHLVVAGGSFIGLELGTIWNRLGARVTVIEMLPRLVPSMDQQVADCIHRALRRQGIQIKLAARITGVRRVGSKAIIQYNAGGGSEEVDCDRILMAVGRRPLTYGLGLEELGARFDERGRLVVDGNYQTTIMGVYAIGDMVPGPMLAHKASAEAVACVERMNGLASLVEYEFIPSVVYTSPEGASVGASEEQLKDRGIPYRVGRFNFAASGRARCLDEMEGFVKILAHQETDRVLGVHIAGARASDLIAESVSVMSFCGTARDIALTCHAHPTLSEAVREAALDVHGESLHA